MKKALSLLLFITPAFALSDVWIKVGYGVVVLVALFVLYKLIKTTEEEDKSTKKVELPWNEMKSINHKAGRLSKKKIEIEDAFDNAKITKWGEGDKVYD